MSSLYLHIPFCRQRCIYCDFYFVTTHRGGRPFVDVLLAEIQYLEDRYGDRERIETIYFGGGTPSLLAVEEVDRILRCIGQHFDISGVRETSFELNPDDVDAAYLNELRQAGVDRLSIGVQSFFEDDLRWMNRAHTVGEARSIVPLARAAGFENLSIDLIFGLPHQSRDAWLENLRRAVELAVPHLSTYSLTIEPRTPLFNQVQRGLVSPAPDETLEALFRETMDVLRGDDYEHYEVSSFARPGFCSQHNQQYWRHANYLGLGPSAHSFWREGDRPGRRWANARNLRLYEQWPSTGALPLAEDEELSDRQLANEYIMLRLRTRDGLDLGILNDRYGVALRDLKDSELQEMEAKGLVEFFNQTTLRLTDDGLLVCDAVTERLLI